MKDDVKHKILATAAALIHRQGFHHTGLQEILTAAQVPKGSFYFYFRNKEDLGLQVVDYFGQLFRVRAKEFLDDPAYPPLVRLRRLFNALLDYFRSGGFSSGCAVGNLAQEMGDLSPALRDRLARTIAGMAELLAGPLREAQAAGELRPGLEPQETGYFLVAAWQGALIRMKACKGPEPLLTFDKIVFESLLR